jgi:hypothetical protein
MLTHVNSRHFLITSTQRLDTPAAGRNVQLEVGAKVELHSLNATEHNGKHGELLEYDEETQRWAGPSHFFIPLVLGPLNSLVW